MGQRYGLIWAQRHLQTWSREEVRGEEGGKNGGMKGKRNGDTEEIEGEVDDRR